jgi:hypothetical protein
VISLHLCLCIFTCGFAAKFTTFQSSAPTVSESATFVVGPHLSTAPSALGGAELSLLFPRVCLSSVTLSSAGGSVEFAFGVSLCVFSVIITLLFLVVVNNHFRNVPDLIIVMLLHNHRCALFSFIFLPSFTIAYHILTFIHDSISYSYCYSRLLFTVSFDNTLILILIITPFSFIKLLAI